MSDRAAIMREHRRANQLTPEAKAKARADKEAKAKEAAAEQLMALFEADPEAFQKAMGKVAQKMLIPHSEGQGEVLSAEERFLVLCAGRRWGKTKIGAARIIREARTKPGMKCAWVAPVYRIVKRGYAEVVAQIPEGLLIKPAPPDTAFDAGRAIRLEFKNGSYIEFYSAERADVMLGASFDFLVLDEAATMKEHVWTQIIRPTLVDRKGRCLFISTPRQRNWFYYIWLRGQSKREEDADFRSWRFPSNTNPTLPAGEVDDMARDMSAVEYEQEVLADFISDAASVFRFPHAKDPDTGEIDETRPSPALRTEVMPRGHVTVGLDLAKHSDWTVIFAINSDSGLPCHYDRFQQVSWPRQRDLIYSAIAVIMETASGVTVIVDSGGPGDVIYDDLEDEGYDVIPINFTNYKEKMVRLLASDLEQGRAFILPDMRSEFDHYGYSVTPSGRWRYEAVRGHDDEVSATLLAHWGRIHEGAPNVQTLTVDSSYDPQPTGGWDEPYMDYGVDTGKPSEESSQGGPSLAALLMNNPRAWG